MAKVSSLSPAGAAAGCGLQVGDIVVSVNDELITSHAQAVALIKSSQGEVKISLAPRGAGKANQAQAEAPTTDAWLAEWPQLDPVVVMAVVQSLPPDQARENLAYMAAMAAWSATEPTDGPPRSRLPPPALPPPRPPPPPMPPPPVPLPPTPRPPTPLALMPPPPSEGPPKQVEPTDAELAELEDLVRTSNASDVGERPAETQAETV